MKVLISGLSIAGPSLAYWLIKYGHDVTIVERAKTLRPGGYGVDIRGAALTVIERMGIMDDVRAHDTHMGGTYFVNATGKIEGMASEAAVANQHDDIEIMRDDLSTILYHLTKDSATYLWGNSIKSMRDTSKGVNVVFQNGEKQTFDIVVGADGLHSNVRGLTFGDEKQFLKPLGSYISIFTIDNYKKIDHKSLMYTSAGKTVGMYSARGNTEAKAMFVFTSDPLSYDYHNQEEQKRILAEKYANETGWETQTLLKKMQSADDFYFDAVSQIHMPSWHKGRVVLVGDAAYGPSPLSGQGSGLALVGAYILAGELHKAKGDYKKAFTAYEEKARPFMEKNQKVGAMVAGSMIESSALKIRIRTLMLRAPFLMEATFKMVTKVIAKAANSISIERY